MMTRNGPSRTISRGVVRRNVELINGGKQASIQTQAAGCVIIMARNLVVLVRPKGAKDEWLLPKGHVEAGESLLDCAAREALEETGVTIAPLKTEDAIRTTTLTIEKDGEPVEEQTIHWFAARGVALKTESQVDDREIGIFPVHVALARLSYEDQREVLAQVLGGE